MRIKKILEDMNKPVILKPKLKVASRNSTVGRYLAGYYELEDKQVFNVEGIKTKLTTTTEIPLVFYSIEENDFYFDLLAGGSAQSYGLHFQIFLHCSYKITAEDTTFYSKLLRPDINTYYVDILPDIKEMAEIVEQYREMPNVIFSVIKEKFPSYDFRFRAYSGYQEIDPKEQQELDLNDEEE